MAIIIQVSFAAMIFSGPLAEHFNRGIGLTLAGAFVMALVTALLSSFRPSINFPQDAPVAIFAGAAGGIAVALAGVEGQGVFMTVVAALMVSTMLTAVLSVLAAWLRFAEYLRFMPYPVVAGFLAGTGWLLSKGSIEVMTGLSLSWSLLGRLIEPAMLVLWLPGVAYALLLFVILRRFSHFLILPGSLVVMLLVYYSVMPMLGIDLDHARQTGILFEPFSTGSLWPVFGPADLADVHWGAVTQQLPTLIVVPFIALLGLLLNMGGIELAAKRDLDMNRELLANGVGNALSAVAGAPAGYHTLSLSMLGLKTGADTRLVGLTVALTLGAVMLFGGQLLAFFPKALLGGFLLLLGLFFISDWILDTRTRMPKADYAVVVAVLAVIAVFGYLHGVLLGLVATIVLFVVRFSQVPVLRNVATGAVARSQKQRSLPQQHLLTVHGHEVGVFELTGYLFFGSVNKLGSAVFEMVEQRPPRYVLVDFERVSGFDISAVNNFVRLFQRLSTRGVGFVLADAPPRFADLLRQVGGDAVESGVQFMPDRNAALEWCEERILVQAHADLAATTADGAQARHALFDDLSDEMLKRLEAQEYVESLSQRMEGIVQLRQIAKGTTLLAAGAPAEGLIVVRGGVVAEYVEHADGRRSALRSLGSGSVFAEAAAYGPWTSSHTYVAESEVEACVLTPDDLRRLEAESPDTALEVHRLVVGALAQGGHSSM